MNPFQHLVRQLCKGFPGPQSPNSGRVSQWRSKLCSRLIFVLCVITLTSALGQRFYNAPKLDVGKASPQAIYAPASATVEDGKATEEKRKEARKEASSVLMLDPSVNQSIRESIQRQFQQGNDLRQQVGKLPFTKALTVKAQAYLRRTGEEEWQALLVGIDAKPLQFQAGPAAKPTQGKAPWLQDANWQQAARELQTYRRNADPVDYLTLFQEISQARQRYATVISALPPLLPGSRSGFDIALLDLTDAEWQQAQTQILRVSDRILAQGIAPGLPEDVLTTAVTLQVKGTVPATAEPMATRLLLAALQPNLVKDEEKTRLLGDRAALEVEPELVTIRQGETIVKAGEIISSADFALLDYFGLSRRGTDWSGLFLFGGLVTLAVAGYWFVEQHFRLHLRRRDRLLIWLLALSTPLLILLRVPSTNLPAVGLLVGSFYGSPMGLLVTGLLASLLPLGMTVQWGQLLSSAAAGLLCGQMAGRLRSREELALLGGVAGILQGALYLLLNVASGTVWYSLLGKAAFHALLGLTWCVVAIGTSPYLEQVFDLVTTIRLVELSNPNRPLLKRLASETPGTFQHTLFVATLAEAAAKALGCNVELVRAGTLYHDIGKMHDPLGFIENQMGGPNKHDLIDDPWKSAAIIKKHVTEGLVMARKFRLPKAVQAFIPEHQGTMLIAYFYHQAQQRVAQNPALSPVNDAEFRYDGPAPRSRETGIVMLADSCEAALRSLKEVDREAALVMINKILRARWQDNQLADSKLTREELTQIASIFVDVWQQFNHQRIPYPKAVANSQPAPIQR
mgnify:CR=1 FL=1